MMRHSLSVEGGQKVKCIFFVTERERGRRRQKIEQGQKSPQGKRVDENSSGVLILFFANCGAPQQRYALLEIQTDLSLEDGPASACLGAICGKLSVIANVSRPEEFLLPSVLSKRAK